MPHAHLTRTTFQQVSITERSLRPPLTKPLVELASQNFLVY
ncbi:hypothetical protein [Nostoc sp. CHAB 5715]|nr:hypothetical protein [Nostoc sp. CHAB 5715]